MRNLLSFRALLLGSSTPYSQDFVLEYPPFNKAWNLQQYTLQSFFRIAQEITPEPFTISPPFPEIWTFPKNIFSTTFLALTHFLVPNSPYLPLYAMVNQCMRAWVTGCDNVLDHEYKPIFFFHGISGNIMQSVLTIMLSDRILTEYLHQENYPSKVHSVVSRISYQGLLSSAQQEGEEESRPVPILSSETILNSIHIKKTGDLFIAPFLLPNELEQPSSDLFKIITQVAQKIGLACQCLDDLKDFNQDLEEGRHNLACSLLAEKEGVSFVEKLRKNPPDCPLWNSFPSISDQIFHLSIQLFEAVKVLLPLIGWHFDQNSFLQFQWTFYHVLGLDQPFQDFLGKKMN